MFRIVLDPTKCDGCRTCEAVCACVNEGEANPAKARIKVVRTVEEDILYSIPVFCMQCERAACEEVCPRHAISRGPNGVLSVDEEKCVGCRMCEIACPVGAVMVNVDRHVSTKCNQCEVLGGEPQCVKHCFTGALQFVPADRVGVTKARAKSAAFLELQRRPGVVEEGMR